MIIVVLSHVHVLFFCIHTMLKHFLFLISITEVTMYIVYKDKSVLGYAYCIQEALYICIVM
jgi:hypothetical protein